MTEKPSDPRTVKTNIRFPAKLYAELKDSAARADQSINAEVVSRCTAAGGGASLSALLDQNKYLANQNKLLLDELRQTKEMVQAILSAIRPRR